VSLREDFSRLRTDRLHQMNAEQLAALAEAIDRQARALLSGHYRQAELDVPLRLSKAEMDGGRGVEAVLDLVRSEEKVVSAALGPNQSKAFLDRVSQLMERSIS
jgi:hypothetical protein